MRLDEPLGLVVHRLPEPGAALSRQRSAGRLKMLLVLAICAAPVVASYVAYHAIRPGSAGASAYGELIQPVRPIPPIDATTLDGRRVPLRDLAGQWLLVVVGPAAGCDESCERRLFMQRQQREMTGRERERLDKVWLITDAAPLRPALRAALQATPAMHLLRVEPQAARAWLGGAAGAADVERGLYVVDPLGQLMMREPGEGDPSKIRRDLDRLLRASASWDRPGRQKLIEPSASAAPAAPAR